MWEDPIVADVRRVRRELDAASGGSFAELYAQALKIQADVTERLVHTPPQPAQVPSAEREESALSNRS